jgi:protein-S-isoprenylcysteine O-methyltransferase Ste14
MDPIETQKNPGLSVHQILAQGYLIYLAAIVIGFGASYLWPENASFLFEAPSGFLLIVLGTAIIYWAQYATGSTSSKRNNNEGAITKQHFFVGPYKYSRSPTQYGLFLMAFGLALLYGSLYMTFTTVVALLIGKFVIIPHEEKHLARRYGAPYLEYKKEVIL